jgi:hypothetical protein
MKVRLQKMMDVVLVAAALAAAGSLGLGSKRAFAIPEALCHAYGGICLNELNCPFPNSNRCSGGDMTSTHHECCEG